MKKIIIVLLFVLAFLVMPYLPFALYAWDLNPANWSEDTRLGAACALGILFICTSPHIAILALGMMEKKP